MMMFQRSGGWVVLFCQVNYNSTILHSVTVSQCIVMKITSARCPVPSLPQNPHDPEYLSNPPHLVLVLVAAASSPLLVRPASRVQQLQAERGEVREDAQQVYDVHAALDEPDLVRSCYEPDDVLEGEPADKHRLSDLEEILLSWKK